MSERWSDEETDDPLYADRRNFYKVEKWTEDEQRSRRTRIGADPKSLSEGRARADLLASRTVYRTYIRLAAGKVPVSAHRNASNHTQVTSVPLTDNTAINGPPDLNLTRAPTFKLVRFSLR
jgi:hypothetical protein